MTVRPLTEAPPPRRRRIRKLRLFVLTCVLLVLLFSAFSFGFVTAIASEIPKLDPARQPQVNGYVYAADGKTVLAVLRGSESRVLVDWEEISDVMKQAIVAIEDRRFFEHRGIDLRGIGRALWADIQHKGVVEGGSTITQQFIKNVYGETAPSLSRKVREAALAWQLEQQWGQGGKGKERILTAYLNTIYFGNGAYGIQQAARVYFGHGAKTLTLPEAALLAGIPADPSSYDPVARPRAARARRETVLRAMLEQKAITPSEFRAANRAGLPSPDEVRLPGTQSPHAPYFTNYVTERLVDRYGARQVFGGGFRVKTTIDLGLQQLARDAIAEALPDPDGPAAALVAIDPTTGDVLAMVGGRSYRESQFNLAVQSRRQPGSSFKPFVLASALEHGISPATRFVSKPLSISLGDRFWSVSNYEDAYLGSVDLETATVHSDNSVYAQLTQLVGPGAVVRQARELGITSPLRNYFSIGLGAQSVNPLELARAFGAFANGGYRIDTLDPRGRPENRPRVVDAVKDERGRTVDDWRPVSKQVLSERTAGFLNALLQGAIERGTGKRAILDGWSAAGKTGTTENFGDAWFVGYTPQLVTAVWVGYPSELRPMLTEFSGEAVAGGTFPALVWKSFMEKALEHLGKEPESFQPPPSLFASPQLVVHRDGRLQRDNGVCEASVAVIYFSGFGPRTTANCKPNEVEVPRVIGQTLGRAEARLAAQPLTPVLVYKPALPRQPVGVVLEQRPVRGRLSSFDRVILFLAKPEHGVVPELGGATLRKARERLRKVRLRMEVAGFVDGPPGRIVAQAPRSGVAAAPGMVVRVFVTRG